MKRRIALIALALGGLSLLSAGAAETAGTPFLAPLFGAHKPQPALVFTYRGWRVDARSARLQNPTKTVRNIKAQLDLVEGVGLPPKILVFMRAIPIATEPGTGPEEPGRYVRGRGVLIHATGLDEKRPVILRQLLYAYQDKVLPGGFANPDVARFRREAAAEHVWPNTAAMLRSDPDYFAMVASAYLYGTITREPYTRKDLLKTQPAAYQWLAGLFDGGKPRL